MWTHSNLRRFVLIGAMFSLVLIVAGCEVPIKVTISSPADGSALIEGIPVLFKAEYNGTGQIKWQTAYIDGDGQSQLIYDADFKTGVVDQGKGYPLEFTKADLPLGSHTITAYNDANGNGRYDSGSENEYATIAITIDASDDIKRDFYSFVWYAGELGDNTRVLRTLGAGAILSEGPAVLSKSLHWGRATLTNFSTGEYDVDARNYDDVQWIVEAKANGQEVLLSINTGQDNNSNFFEKLLYTPWVSCGTPLCPNLVDPGAIADCPPKDDEHWQKWYEFVFDVVTHFDGSAPDQPEVCYFLSRTEASSPYWKGTKEDLLGHLDPDNHLVSIDRVAANGSTSPGMVERALAPIMHAAIQDANAHRQGCDARFVIGIPSVLYQLTEVREELLRIESSGNSPSAAEKANVVEIARSANFYANKKAACLPTSSSFNTENCYDAIVSFFSGSNKELMRCIVDVGIHSLDTADNGDYLSLRFGDVQFTGDATGVIGYMRGLQYVDSRIPSGTKIWDLGAVGVPTGMDDTNAEKYLARDRFQRLIVAFRTEVEHFGFAWLYTTPSSPPLSDPRIDFYHSSLGGPPWEVRHTVADSMALLARMVPEKAAIQPGAASWVYFDNTWETWEPGDPLWRDDGGEIQYAKAVLFSFSLYRRDMEATAKLVAGWCLDQSPWDPNVFETQCPQLDVGGFLELTANMDVAVYDGYGQFDKLSTTGVSGALNQTCSQVPFLWVWGGNDRDSDGIPDVCDNCPDVSNPDQAEDITKGFYSLEEPSNWIVAPDGVGTACD